MSFSLSPRGPTNPSIAAGLMHAGAKPASSMSEGEILVVSAAAVLAAAARIGTGVAMLRAAA
eukprot:6283216-Prymnesium_polylepis.1